MWCSSRMLFIFTYYFDIYTFVNPKLIYCPKFHGGHGCWYLQNHLFLVKHHRIRLLLIYPDAFRVVGCTAAADGRGRRSAVRDPSSRSRGWPRVTDKSPNHDSDAGHASSTCVQVEKRPSLRRGLHLTRMLMCNTNMAAHYMTPRAHSLAWSPTGLARARGGLSSICIKHI